MELTRSYRTTVPESIQERYEIFEVRNAASILAHTNPQRFRELCAVLDGFQLYTDDLVKPGGQESQLAARLNGAFRSRGWREARVDTIIELVLSLTPYGGEPKLEAIHERVVNEGYMVDNFSGRVALDVEWNAKDGNLDRDLAAYRFLYDSALIDCAVIVTRVQKGLRELGRELGLKAGLGMKKAKAILGTTTTTNTDKLVPRMTRGDAGGCPLLVVAICERTWAGENIHPPTDAPTVTTASDEQEMPVIKE